MPALPLLVLLAALSTGDAGAAPDPAPAAPEGAVLLLKSGQSMEVRSYVLDGRVVRVVGADGSPLVIKADLVDLEGSEAATRRFREERARQAAAAEAAAEAAAAQARRKEEERAARKASHPGRGSMNVGPRTASPGTGPKAGDREPAGPGPAPGDAEPRLKPWEERRVKELRAQIQALRKRYGELVKESQNPMAAYDQILVEANGLRSQMDAAQAELDRIEGARR